MSLKKILQAFQDYQHATKEKRESYLHRFEEKMIYRTTKTENPETTPAMVTKVLHKLKKA